VKLINFIRQIALALVIFCCSSSIVQAQAQTGVPPFGAFQPGGFDGVNLQNLNNTFTIPIMSSPGRGIGLNYSMAYNAAFWQVSSGAWTPLTNGSGTPIMGWSVPGEMGVVSYTSESVAFGTCWVTYFSNFVFTESNGTAHPFAIGYYTSNTCGFATSASGYSSDNTGFFLSSSVATGFLTSTVTFPSGATQTGTSTLTLTDANGNYITQTAVSSSETDWTDSVGRTAAKVVVGSPNTTVQWLNPSGTYETTTIKYSSFSVMTHFNCSGIVEYSGTMNLPTEIDLPNGPKYLFTYETTPGYSGY
jgi:hypothetical protein